MKLYSAFLTGPSSAKVRLPPQSFAVYVRPVTVLYDKGVTMSKQQVFRQWPVKITRAVIDAAWKKRAPVHRTILNDVDCRGLTPADDGRRLTLNLGAKPRNRQKRSDSNPSWWKAGCYVTFPSKSFHHQII